MRKLLTILFLLPLFLAAQQPVTITVTVLNATRASSSMAPTLANKTSVVKIMVDDRLPASRTMYAVMHGGTDPFTGKVYPGYSYTDGCGNNIGYKGGIALNIVAPGTTQDLESTGGGPTTSYLSWSEIKGYIQNGFDPMAHGWQHNETTGWPGFVQNVVKCIQATYDSTNALGVPFVLRNWVTPNADNGYLAVAESAHMRSGTSTNDLDGYPTYPSFNATNNFTTVDSLNRQGFVFEKRDYTGSNSRAADVTYFSQKIDNMLSQASTTNRPVLSFFTHQIDSSDGFNAIVQHLFNASGDKTWVCSNQQFYDYMDCMHRYVKSERFSGNTLTITLDPKNIPDAARYRDLSLLISTDGTISNVTVSGAGSFDSYSWSNANKLINIFKKKTTGFQNPSAVLSYSENSKYPMQRGWFYQINPQVGDPSALIDGDTLTYFSAVSQLLMNPHRLVFHFPDTSGMIVHTFSIYQKDWASFTPKTYIYLRRKVDRKLILLDSFWNNTPNNAWHDMTPANSFVADEVVAVGDVATKYGTEWKVTGDFTSWTPPSSYVKSTPAAPVKNLIGTNTYWWDMLDDPTGAHDYSPGKWAVVNKYTYLRLYADTRETNPRQGRYAFNPTLSGRNNDRYLDSANAAGATVVFTMQGITDSIMNTYPDHSNQHIPLAYGDMGNGRTPQAYKWYGQLGWQVAKRYGRDTTQSSLISVWNPQGDADPSVHWMQPNVARAGLNRLKYIEIGNEWDKNWTVDSTKYLDGWRAEAFASAVYDGDQGRLGPGVGIKAADTSMIVVMAGQAYAQVDWWLAFREATIINRGYKADGTPDYPFNVINFHRYPTNDGSQNVNLSNATGIIPEAAALTSNLQAFRDMANKYFPGLPVWHTEWGYDTSQRSPYRAPAKNGLTGTQMQGIWAMRHLAVQSAYLDGGAAFQAFDPDTTAANFSTQFNTMGWSNHTEPDAAHPTRPVDYSARDAYNYAMQMKSLVGEYSFNQWMQKDNNAWVIQYVRPGSNTIYMCWIADSLGRTGTYSLPVSAGQQLNIWTPQGASPSMTLSTVQATGATYSVPISEKAVFVEVLGTSTGGGGTPGSSLRIHSLRKIKIR